MIKAVDIDKTKRYLNVELNSGKTYSYPWIWLRDNCRCEDCLSAESESRKTQIKDLDLECEIASTQVSEDGSEVTLRWSDDHLSTFKSDWLIENRFTKDGMEQRKHYCRLTPRIWGENYGDKMLKVDFNKFLTDDNTTYKCLVTAEESGIFLLENAPQESGALKQIAGRVNSWLRPQHHGSDFANREVYSVRTDMSQAGTSIVQVYTSGRLHHHTDMSYCVFPPGLQMLHCIQQTPSKGGDSMFCDGFKVATIMREKYPELFDVLVRTPVSNNDFGGYYYEFNFVCYGTTIRLDADGDLESIRFANHARYCGLNAPLDQVETFYRAYQKFEALLEEHHIEYKLRPGDIVCFNNHRVTHGRLPFEMVRGSVRHLQGSYIEWDDLLSARRVLQKKFQETPSLKYNGYK